MQKTFNPDRILDAILETFVEYDNWLTFRQLAHRLTGDTSNEQLIAGIVDRHSGVLMVTDGCRCKLRTEFIEDAAGISSRQQLSKHLLYHRGYRLSNDVVSRDFHSLSNAGYW